jgi:hypothetical protein
LIVLWLSPACGIEIVEKRLAFPITAMTAITRDHGDPF